MSKENEDTIHFPATYAGMSQKADGAIVVKFELDASQLAAIQRLGAEWLDMGLLVAITPNDDETIAG